MDSSEETLFDVAMKRYQEGADARDLLKDFESITAMYPGQSAGWTCLAWLQLLSEQNEEALRSARTAVKLNKQDPQARINLSLALLATNSKGVRDHIEFVKRALLVVPDFESELKSSIEDGLKRKPEWESLKKIKNWLEL
tara:strand:+ start:242 stop:661 length:420 start_codon:yes stop_codon:yes gene_type:complete